VEYLGVIIFNPTRCKIMFWPCPYIFNLAEKLFSYKQPSLFAFGMGDEDKKFGTSTPDFSSWLRLLRPYF
jgi:hypothetical protein